MITEQILPQFQQTGRIVTGSSKKTDGIIEEVQQLKDQSAVAAQQTASNTSTLDRIDGTSPQILSNTVLILEHLQQLRSKFSQGGVSTGVGHLGAEQNVESFDKLSFGLARTPQSHVSIQNIQIVMNQLTKSVELQCAIPGQ